MTVPQVPGVLSTVATMLYLATALLCAFAWFKAARNGPRLPTFHARIWLFAMVLFLVLAASRWFGLEESLRIFLRGGLRADGLYQERREFQAVIASAALVIAVLLGMICLGMMLRSGVLQKSGASRVAALAGCAGAALVLLVALRVVSFHAIDVVLYRGPRLNWFLDIGATLGVAAAAVWYVQLLGKPALRRR